MSEYTLDQLAEETGITARTIRSYIEKGLLPGPGSMGPKARYSDEHLEKLRTIQYLKDSRGLALGDIRQLLVALSESALRQVRKQKQLRIEAFSDAASAMDYIRRIAAQESESPRRGRGARSVPKESVKVEGPLRDLLDGLRRLAGGRKVTRRTRAESWRRIEVTPDFEIHVRGGLPYREIRQIERIADHLRTLLIGG